MLLPSWKPQKASLSPLSRWWRVKPWTALGKSSRNKAFRLTSLLRKAGTSAQISCKKPMALPKPQKSVFLDSSVLYAAVFSPTGPARRLILKGIAGSSTVVISELVLEETKRNLTRNAPGALPYFTLLTDLF